MLPMFPQCQLLPDASLPAGGTPYTISKRQASRIPTLMGLELDDGSGMETRDRPLLLVDRGLDFPPATSYGKEGKACWMVKTETGGWAAT
ncbi:MAG: hypothetical protein H7Z75_12355 [Ferruginibacter sp.]|nr:hypothetical protein [Cytophagales bacterium]